MDTTTGSMMTTKTVAAVARMRNNTARRSAFSLGPGEHEPTIKQEDVKITVHILDGVYPSAVEEVKVDVKQEVKGEILAGPFIGRLMLLRAEKEEIFAPGAASGPVATGSGIGEATSRMSEVGLDVKMEARMVSGPRSLQNPRARASLMRPPHRS